MTYRKQGNRANLKPAHDSDEVRARLDKEERRKLVALFNFVETYRTREIVETESFAELLTVQRTQGSRLDALQVEYGRLLRAIAEVREQLVTLEIDLSRDRKRNRQGLEILNEAMRRVNDMLNLRLAAGLPAIDPPKKTRR